MSRPVRFLLPCLCAAVLAAAPALRAQTLVNGDFEAPSMEPGNFRYTPDQGEVTWTFTGSTGISETTGPWAPDAGAGSQMAFLQILDDGDHSFYQSSSFAIGGSFTLTYQVGTRQGYPGIDYSVRLVSDMDSTVVFGTTDTTLPGQAFATRNYTVSVPQAGNYTLIFQGIDHGNFDDRSAVFDNISMTTAVPEPAVSAGLLGAAALGAGWVRRARRGALRS